MVPLDVLLEVLPANEVVLDVAAEISTSHLPFTHTTHYSPDHPEWAHPEAEAQSHEDNAH